MNKKDKLFHLLKIIILSMLFYAAVYFENAGKQRLFVLLGIFFVYIAWGLGRNLIKKQENLYSMSFLIDIAFIYILEYNSRLMINYFFHFFYFIVLLESAIILKGNRGLLVGTTGVIVSLIKYILLIYYKPNLSNVSQMIFFLLVSVLTLIIINLAQYNKREKEKKDILYKELLDAHKELKRFSEEVRRLTIVEERNLFARDIHDTLGHNMTALIMQMEMAGHIIDDDILKAKDLLEKAKRTARETLTSIREVVETLRGNDTDLSTLKAIKDMIGEFSEKTGIVVKFKIDNEGVKQDIPANMVLYRIIQESLTNSVRHGKATQVEISLGYYDKVIKFFIKDNGHGVTDLREGYGLKGIRERVESLNGKVMFETHEGFTIKGMLYYGGEQ